MNLVHKRNSSIVLYELSIGSEQLDLVFLSA